ncbi:hypothetical protein J2Y58_003522 [Sphingomonas sp. BE138]|uniref:hypothetical protein n=1 Tax=Sphingomonas sp. BE138 TaxID=2817845 RepID=UPI002860FFF0|nr:hypothetical protein [Sphingomonas sp. BE138]MDR6790142.1 hypothetical protein [Sphingomonas sp. BE138]
MIPFCLILGDSTAIGTASALATQGIRCEVHARVGAGSGEIARDPRPRPPAPSALIALGSNDPLNPALARNLTMLRSRTTAFRVTWLAPYDARAARVVATVARAFGDSVIQLAAIPSADGVHPTSYRMIAAALRWKDVAENRQPLSVVFAQRSATSAPLPHPAPVTRKAVVLIMK